MVNPISGINRISRTRCVLRNPIFSQNRISRTRYVSILAHPPQPPSQPYNDKSVTEKPLPKILPCGFIQQHLALKTDAVPTKITPHNNYKDCL